MLIRIIITMAWYMLQMEKMTLTMEGDANILNK
jgi:hypothetical protein